ncbi:IclR family transcriptional regulator [Humitalea sp. 24SJ18S-53]|uniref:IclR family transcriptional regulator n=1 Tax=Humitalea sp. 24SJ18S-53 TaxID=3422307 RepID=UPI003D6649EC
MPRQRNSAVQQAPAPGDDKLFVEAAARAFHVLEAFSGAPGPLSLGDIAKATGLDRSAVQRSTHTLLRLGYLRQRGTRGGLVLGLKIFDRSFDCLRSDPLFERAMPILIDLRQDTQERVDLTVFDDLTMLYVLRLQSRRETFLAGLAGTRIPTYCSSGGRAVLSRLDKAAVDDVLARSDRRRITPHTVADLTGIRARLAEARELGYALATEEVQIGIVALAAPILGSDGLPAAAVQITASLANQTPAEMARRFGPLVVEAARAASAI